MKQSAEKVEATPSPEKPSAKMPEPKSPAIQDWENEGGAIPVVAQALEIAEQKIRKKKRKKARKRSGPK